MPQQRPKDFNDFHRAGGSALEAADSGWEKISPSTQSKSKWRSQYKVHPAAHVFPMMSDEELRELGEDIKADGLKAHITVDKDGILLDGRNRLEAIERAGLSLKQWQVHVYPGNNPVGWIISANIHRRNLTKQQQADLIVAAHKAAAEKPRQLGEVSKPLGGRGNVDETKAAVVAAAKEQGIGKRTVERAIARAKTEPKTEASAPKVKPERDIEEQQRQRLRSSGNKDER